MMSHRAIPPGERQITAQQEMRGKEEGRSKNFILLFVTFLADVVLSLFFWFFVDLVDVFLARGVARSLFSLYLCVSVCERANGVVCFFAASFPPLGRRRRGARLRRGRREWRRPPHTA